MKRSRRIGTNLSGLLAAGAVVASTGGLALSEQQPPWLVIRNKRFGFVAGDGALLAEPRYALCGRWSEGRLWVSESPGAQAPGFFLDARGRPVTPSRFFDLSHVRPELPLPAFDGGLAVVGLPQGRFGYLDRNGRLLGTTTPFGAFHRQDGDLLLFVDDMQHIGFMDRRGRTRIPARYREASPFRGGVAAARESAQWGLIDATGNWTAAPDFDELVWFAEEPRCWAFRIDAHWGLIDRRGHRLAEARYDGFGVWHGATLSVRINGAWGLLSASGTLLMEPCYAAIEPFGEEPGIWAVMSKEGLWGLASVEGRETVPPAFRTLAAPVRGVWIAACSEGWGLLDAQGGWRTPPRYTRIVPLTGALAGLALCERERAWGLLDAAVGAERVPPVYARLQPWHTLLSAFDGDGVMRLLDAQGSVVQSWQGAPEGLPAPHRMPDGIGVLRAAQFVTLIARDGTLPSAQRFDAAGEWADGLLPVREHGLWAYVDRHGRFRVTPRYQAADAFAEGVAAVREQGQWGLVDREGNHRVSPAFDALGRAWNGLVPAMRNNRWGLIDLDGGIVLPLEFDGIEWGTDAAGQPVYYAFDPPLTPGLGEYAR